MSREGCTVALTGRRREPLEKVAAEIEKAGGKTLVAWNNNEQIGWQLYGEDGKAVGEPGTAKSAGKGVAGVVGKDGRFILFR